MPWPRRVGDECHVLQNHPTAIARAASAVQTTEIIRLKYGVAEDVVSMLNTLEKSRQGEGAEADKEAVLVADKRTNSVVVTADELSVDRIRKLVAYLDTPLEQSGNVRVIYLEYADATTIAEVLTRVMQNISRLEEGGSNKRAGNSESTIEADEGTNSLIITADTDEMAALEAVIARLDIRRAQVLIEAIIVEVGVAGAVGLFAAWKPSTRKLRRRAAASRSRYGKADGIHRCDRSSIYSGDV